jgi:hypothetical protein
VAAQAEADAALVASDVDAAADASEFAARVQWRVRRIWDLLRFTALQRLDMLIAFAQWGFADKVESELDAWERAAAAVMAREKVLADVVEVPPL